MRELPGRCERVEDWARHIRWVCQLHGFEPSEDVAYRLAEDIVADAVRIEAEVDRLRSQPQEAARIRAEICAHVAKGSSYSTAAGAAGVSVDVFERWMQVDETFGAAVRNAVPRNDISP